MPDKKLIFRPGVNTELSQVLNKDGVSGSNLIRVRQGLLEKIGGWMRLSSTQMIGSVRRMHAWADLSGGDYLALGSEAKLQVFSSTVVTDVTPIIATSNRSNPFSTTSGSSVVTVHDASNPAAVGSYVIVPVPAAIGGLIIYGPYVVASIIDADHYTIDTGTAATGTVSNSGVVPAFTSTNTSATVSVALTAHGYLSNTPFVVAVSTSVGGLTIVGTYLIATITDANHFTITAATTAGSTATVSENSGNVRFQYQLVAGLPSNTPLLGWGSGTWGTGVWGGSGVAGGISPLRNWSLDNFGENLMAVPTLGSLYVWIPPVSLGNFATLVSAAPTPNWAMFVTMPEAQVVLLGTSVLTAHDPMLLAWSDAGDYTTWTADITNQAGTFRLSRGSRIVGGRQAPQMALIWTDVGLWSMHYIAPPLIYSFEEIGVGCGLVATNAHCVLDEQVFWLSQKSFFVLDGQGLRPLPCSVWTILFRNLTSTQTEKIHLGANSNFAEIMLFYPSATGAGEVDSYVKFNMTENVWDYGSLVRLAWFDQSVFGPPLGIDGPNGLIQQHEVAVDADGQAMTGVEFLSGYADVADGTMFIFLKRLIPDFQWDGSTAPGNEIVTVTIYLLDYPGDSNGAGPGVIGPLTVTSATQYISINKRCRRVALKVQSDGLGVQWRWGAFAYEGGQDGRL